jgi:uncharacterized protein YdhG (YjbR/CyaY superfamily)
MNTSQTTKNTRSAASSADTATAGVGFSAEERAAMQERAAELKAAARRGAKASKADGESDLLAKIAAMDEPDRTMAEQVHALVSATAPELTPQTWYGMPAYALDGKVVFFFKPGGKYKMRYSTLGFTDKARLDDGDMWPSEFALPRWSEDVEARIAALVQRAIA